MGFLRRVAGFLGLSREEGHEESREVEEVVGDESDRVYREEVARGPRRGFSVPVQVAVEKTHQVGPVLVPCAPGQGGVQGLRWYTKRLKMDEDGDVADEFLEEIYPATETNSRPLPKFVIKHGTKPVKVREQIITSDGKIRQRVEYKGRLLLV
uniref:Uncharacterized protein n=1 Tax=Kalanchoe fedtschenkoi TaxID=63787 RepID=A0A7N1A5Q3_KALFE